MYWNALTLDNGTQRPSMHSNPHLFTLLQMAFAFGLAQVFSDFEVFACIKFEGKKQDRDEKREKETLFPPSG